MRRGVVLLYLVRHGQTDWSRDSRFCGSGSDVPLSAAGREMAEALASRYGGEPWRAIYSSPMLRTRQTAEPLARRAGLSVRVEDGLREIDYGAWEGLLEAEVRARFPRDLEAWLEDPGRAGPPGGETGLEIAERAVAVIEDIVSRHEEGPVLAVSHKATIRVAVCALLGMDVGRFRARIGQPASAVNVFEFRAGGPLLRALGDTSHLPAHLRHEAGI